MNFNLIIDVLKLILKKPCAFILILFVVILGFSGLLIYDNHYHLKDSLIDYLKHIPAYPEAKPDFAYFDNGNLITELGSSFSTCSDTSRGGHSIINISPQNNELHADFKLNQGVLKLEDAYVCFYATFTTPERHFDLSKFQGISFKSRLNLKSGNLNLDDKDNKLKLIISISTFDDQQSYPNEYDYLTNGLTGNSQNIKVPFNTLKTPIFIHDKIFPPFDPRTAYQVTFSVRGKDQEGTLDIDDIHFYVEK